MKIFTYVVMAIISLVVIGGGVMKLIGNEMVLMSFATLGLPVWFGTFIGACEVAGGIGIWLRRTSMLAAMGLAVIMVGALYYHVMHTPIVEGIAALIVLLGCLFIIRRKGTGIIG